MNHKKKFYIKWEIFTLQQIFIWNSEPLIKLTYSTLIFPICIIEEDVWVLYLHLNPLPYVILSPS